jgi:hypothetical protein
MAKATENTFIELESSIIPGVCVKSGGWVAQSSQALLGGLKPSEHPFVLMTDDA